LKPMSQNNFAQPSALDVSSSKVSGLGNLGSQSGKMGQVDSNSGFSALLMKTLEANNSQSKNSSQQTRSLHAPSHAKVDFAKLLSRSERNSLSAKDSGFSKSLPHRELGKSPGEEFNSNAKADINRSKDSFGSRRDVEQSISKKSDIKTDDPRSRMVDQKSQIDSGSNNVEAQSTLNHRDVEALRPLKSAVSSSKNQDQIVANSAVLSFVTGRLDRIEPTGIPDLISDSPFIKEAVASTDVAQLMSKSYSVADLSKMFEIDEKLLMKAVQNGLDTDALVTPEEFLRCVGVDPGRVSTEMSLLQQRLPIEGVASYVERARKMASAAGQILLGDASDVHVESAEASGQDLNTAMAFLPESDLIDTKDSDLAHIMMQNSAARPAPMGPQTTPATPGNMPVEKTSNHDANRPKPLAQKSATPEGRSAMMTTESLEERILRGKIDVTSSQVGPKFQADNQLNLYAGGQSGDFADSAEFDLQLTQDYSHLDIGTMRDPFEQMRGQMDPSSLKMESFAASTIQKSVNGLEEQLSANNFRIDRDALKLDLKSDDRQVSDLGLGLAEPTKINVATDNLNFTQSLNQLPQITKEAQAGGTFGGTSNFDNSSNDQGHETENSESDLFNVRTDISHAGKVAHHDLNVEKPEHATADVAENADYGNQVKDKLSQKVLQNAVIMLKRGGGSMRLDLHTPGLGKIDLAIQLQQNQLDMRVISANERAHDILGKELSALRDGLGTHGISLRQVEIAKPADGQSSQHQNFAQGQGFNQGKPTYQDMKQYAESFRPAPRSLAKMEQSSKVIPPAFVADRALGLNVGQLAVRV
jgi:hypothetical protein